MLSIFSFGINAPWMFTVDNRFDVPIWFPFIYLIGRQLLFKPGLWNIPNKFHFIFLSSPLSPSSKDDFLLCLGNLQFCRCSKPLIVFHATDCTHCVITSRHWGLPTCASCFLSFPRGLRLSPRRLLESVWSTLNPIKLHTYAHLRWTNARNCV